METITKDIIKTVCMSGNRAETFEEEFPSLQVKKQDGSKTFDVHSLSAKSVFEAQTGQQLCFSSGEHNYYRFLRSEAKVEAVRKWQKQQGETVFIRDCLSGTAALSFTKRSPESTTQKEAYKRVRAAKENQNEQAISYLVNRSSDLVRALGIFEGCEYIAAIPADRDKPYDLPKELAQGLATKLKLTDISTSVLVEGQKRKMRTVEDNDHWFDEKWKIWEDVNVCYDDDGPCLEGKYVLLVDDNYQSGVTMMYIAMILQRAGAANVFGLAMTKTLKDTAN